MNSLKHKKQIQITSKVHQNTTFIKIYVYYYYSNLGEKRNSLHPSRFWACKLQWLKISAVTDTGQIYVAYKRHSVGESKAPHLLIMNDMLLKVLCFVSY